MNKNIYRELIPHFTKNSKPSSIEIVHAEGVQFYDQNGQRYLDFSSQTLNLNLGQCHPVIVKAAIQQIQALTFVSSRFINPPLMELVYELLQIAPEGLDMINLKLVNGSDANESALKRARKLRKKQYIISFFKSHLGESGETLSASGNKESYIGGSNHFLFITPPFKSFLKKEDEKFCEEKSLLEIKQIFQKRNDIAGIILEPIMVNAGAFCFSKSYLMELRNLCDRFDTTLIFDEIQTAFGWLGTHFAANLFDVTPDILTMGKGISAGFPLAGVLMKKEYDVLDYGEDEYTYGGHPVSCATAIANIRLLRTTNILNDVMKKAESLSFLLANLQRRYNYIREIRGYGFIIGIEFDPFHFDQGVNSGKIYNECLSRGLVLRKTENGKGNSLVLKPPLITSMAEIEEAVSILETSIKNVYK